MVDELIRVLNKAGVCPQASADDADVVMMVRDDDEEVIDGVMQYALGLVENL